MGSSTAELQENPNFIHFHLFPRLPMELRLKIWAISVEPRIVQVFFYVIRGGVRHKFCKSIPAVLHANSESRVECLRYYELLGRGSDELLPKNPQDTISLLYFNYEVDTLFMSWENRNGVNPESAFRSRNKWYLENNDCAMLDMDRVQSIAVAGAKNHTVTVNYFSDRHAPQKVVLVNEIRCSKGWNCANKCRGPRYFMTYNELKATSKVEKAKKISWIDMERVGMLRWEKEFKSGWDSRFGEKLPCPQIDSRQLCRMGCQKDMSAYINSDGFLYTRKDSH